MIITRRFEWDAGHRIVGHENKCKHLHGHRYAAEVSIQSSELDSLGRIIDFGKVKEVIGCWIDDEWDHNMILFREDPIFKLSEVGFKVVFGSKEPYRLKENPTAENLAKELFSVCGSLLLDMYAARFPVKMHSVTLYETPNCSATYP